VRGEGAAFKQKISVIVDAVRLMLYSSRSMDKEAPHLQSPEMREPHRHVLTSLSKLILSAKVVNDSPVISANHVHSKVQRDAAELSNAVKKFIQQCQIKNVVIEPVNPRLIELEKENEQVEIEHRTQNTNTSEPTTTISEPTTVEEKRKSDSIPTAKGPVKTKYVLNQDLLVSIQTHAKQIMGTTNALCDASTNIYNIEMDQLISSNNNPDNDAVSEISADMKTEEEKLYMGHRARSCVVFLFQNLSIQVSQYISILGDIDLSKVDSTQIPTLPEFRLSKQKLYNSVGLLFSAVQTLTDVNLDLRSSVEAVDESLKRVEDAIDNIHSNLHQMVTERKMWLRKNESLVNSAAATIDESDGTHSPIHTYFESSTTAMNEGLAKAAAPGYSRSHRGSVNEHEQLSDNGSKSKRLMPNLSQHRPSISLSNGRSGDGSKPLKRQQSYGPQHHGGHHKIDEEYWYLGYDYSEGDIEFTQEKTIKGGTLAGLVERLTLHDYIGKKKKKKKKL
jgi:hypothetical protein